jgi:acetoin utilization deacetylase AcuC-like enzyme
MAQRASGGETARLSLRARVVRAGRRHWRQLRRRWWWHGVRVVYHEAYSGNLDVVPLDRQRAERVASFLGEEGLLLREDVRVPRHPSLRNLLRVHDAEYLESLQDRETLTRIFGAPVSDAELEQVIAMQRMMVGGTILATILALRNRGVAVNLGGGLHHADRSSGAGFCLFNDVAVAIARLRAKGYRDPVLVVDLDMHDGNGTRSVFARDPSVCTYSLHAEHWGDPEAVASTAIALGGGVSDEILLGTLLKTLPDVFHTVRPGLVIYLAGTDGAADDALGSWKLSAAGMLRRDQFVMELARRRGRAVPTVVVLGGGYGDHSWKYTARFVAWLMTRRLIEPPSNEQLLLQSFRRIRRGLDPALLTADPSDLNWKLTEADLVGVLPAVARPTRFLEYFSRHGVELLLERFGILDALRMRGYQHPVVEVDLSHPLGETVRIFGGPDRSELLVELRVHRSSRPVPGLELLVIEWLLLQHPRAEFGPYRRPLPGQRFPGLGMLKDVLGWVVMLCEILGLDGVFYSPSSYHVAAQSRSLVRFLHPEHEARFRALKAAMPGLSLSEASQAVEQGRMRDAATGATVRWEGEPMVLPVSSRLKERVFSESYEAAVAAALEHLEFRLAAAGGSGPDTPAGA